MKTIALLVATALTLSLCFASHTGQGELKERNFLLEGLPVYVQDARKGQNEPLTNEYHLDTSTLEFLIRQIVDPDGWSNPGVMIAPASDRGRDVLKIVQTPLNHERIADLLFRLRKASPNYVDVGEEELFGVPPREAKQ